MTVAMSIAAASVLCATLLASVATHQDDRVVAIITLALLAAWYYVGEARR